MHNRLEETACLAPEQVSGTTKLDSRTDLYALGVLIYQLLTGHPPHVGASCDEVVDRIQHDAVESPRALNRDVPVPFEKLVLRLLANDPDDRFESSAALMKSLQSIADLPEKRT